VDEEKQEFLTSSMFLAAEETGKWKDNRRRHIAVIA